MEFKKILTFSAAALMLASVGTGIGNTQASASDYMGADERRATYSRRVYVHRPIKLEKMRGSVFATMRATSHKWLYKGERIGVVPFYHMGHDGYVVHIPGRSGVYYAPTNSHSWYGKKLVQHHHESKRNRQIDYAWSHAPKYVKGHFIKTNNKKLLKKSGFKYEVPSDKEYPCIISNQLPSSRKAYVPRNVKFSTKRLYQTGWETGWLAYGYVGHNTWKLAN